MRGKGLIWGGGMFKVRPMTAKGGLILVYGLGILLMIVLFKTRGLDVIQAELRQLGWRAWVVYLVLYVVCSLALLPVAWLNLMAGMLFGPWWGALFILMGIFGAASITFLVSRYFATLYKVRQWLFRQPVPVKKWFTGPFSWKTVCVLRLSNAVPFSVINYLAGGMEIAYGPYLLATLAGSVPGTLVYSGLGALLYKLLKTAAASVP